MPSCWRWANFSAPTICGSLKCRFEQFAPRNEKKVLSSLRHLWAFAKQTERRVVDLILFLFHPVFTWALTSCNNNNNAVGQSIRVFLCTWYRVNTHATPLRYPHLRLHLSLGEMLLLGKRTSLLLAKCGVSPQPFINARPSKARSESFACLTSSNQTVGPDQEKPALHNVV